MLLYFIAYFSSSLNFPPILSTLIFWCSILHCAVRGIPVTKKAKSITIENPVSEQHRLGELLCCESCPAVYHLDCIQPPLTSVPERDWACPVCNTSRVRGVSDCTSAADKEGISLRRGCLGRDRLGRKYWFLARRIFVYHTFFLLFLYTRVISLFVTLQLKRILDHI